MLVGDYFIWMGVICDVKVDSMLLYYEGGQSGGLGLGVGSRVMG